MNQSLSDLKLHSFNDINLFQKYEICRQQSQCYLLIPPPQPPILPKLILPNSSYTLTNLRHRTDLFFIILGIFIALLCTCLLLFLLGVKFQFYHKLRQRYRRTKVSNITDGSTSFSNIIQTSYNSLTPLTSTTNQSPSLTTKSNQSLQQHLNSVDQSSYHNHLTNIYEEIRLSSNHHHCSCCSCILTYYQQKQYISTTHQMTPYYYTYESLPSKIVCQNCLLKTLHRKQQCLCQNFFVPIK